MRYFFTGATVAILLLTACGPTATPETMPTFPTAMPMTVETSSSPSPIPTASPQPVKRGRTGPWLDAPADAVILYQRSGGFAGISEGWAIYADGRVVSSDKGEGQVSSEEVADLLRRIEAAGFFNLRDSYLPVDTCCDRFTYWITVRTPGKTKTVITIDAAPEEPTELRMILDKVTRLIEVTRK